VECWKRPRLNTGRRGDDRHVDDETRRSVLADSLRPLIFGRVAALDVDAVSVQDVIIKDLWEDSLVELALGVGRIAVPKPLKLTEVNARRNVRPHLVHGEPIVALRRRPIHPALAENPGSTAA
jgi:hypothetical protein